MQPALKEEPNTMTHTFAVLELSPASYAEVSAKLRAAGYDHAFDSEVIDMHGIGIVPEALVVPAAGMDFGAAIRALKAGHRVARAGWNGKGMWLELQVPDAHSKMSLPYIFMFTACKNQVPWFASQADVLAEDWQIVLD